MAFWNRSRDVEVVERRDPTAATRSLRWQTPGMAAPPDWDAGRAFEVAYYSNIAVYACFQAVAATVSSLPFRAGGDPDLPAAYDPNALLARFLGPPPGGPNPTMSAEELWFFSLVQALCTGRFGWEIETAPGTDTIVALWPLVSAALKPIPSSSGTAWYSGFKYGKPGEERTLSTEQVFYFWNPCGSDFRQPESALEAAALDVSIAVMQSRYDYAFLKNDSRPAALVVTEDFADEDDYRAFRDQWEANYGGPANAGRSAFLEAHGGEQGVKGSVDVTVLGISPRDAQAAQRYASRLQQIAIGLGVPWSRLDASGRTFDNATQEDLIWWEQRLNPLVRRLASAVNIQLAPRLGNLVGWFDLSKVKALQTTPNPVTASVGAPTLVQAQIMTVNEARADYGLPPVPDGDRFMTPEEIQALKTTGPTQMSGLAEEIRALWGAAPVVEVREPAPPTQSAVPVPALEPVPVDHEARRRKVWTTANGKMRNLERQWERALRKLFARQARSVVARLEGKRGRASVKAGEVRATVDEVFPLAHWMDETVDDVTALYESVVAAGGARVSDLFGLAFDLEAPFAQDYITARANQLAGQVTETTYNAIKAAMAEGVGAGESIPELATRIKGVFEVASTSRATTIARTEVISAFNGSANLTATDYGREVVAGKEWIATDDARTREWHAERQGEIVDVGEDFSGGIPYPGVGPPDEVINCRCTVAFLTPEEMATRSGGRSRRVEVGRARAVLALVSRGQPYDERALRAVMSA